jgi:hypothetical protein
VCFIADFVDDKAFDQFRKNAFAGAMECLRLEIGGLDANPAD